jgi:hypothetical protein
LARSAAETAGRLARRPGRRGRVERRDDHEPHQQRTVIGGNGQFGSKGGAGIANPGAIATLSNSRTIRGGAGGSGSTSGAPGDAIYSAGAHASIGSITNSCKIIGNVEIDNQASVTVTGGSGMTFGSWTGGAIMIGNGNLTFASGNTALGEYLRRRRQGNSDQQGRAQARGAPGHHW